MPTLPAIHAAIFCGNRPMAVASSRVCAWITGRFGSKLRIACRTAAICDEPGARREVLESYVPEPFRALGVLG